MKICFLVFDILFIKEKHIEMNKENFWGKGEKENFQPPKYFHINANFMDSFVTLCVKNCPLTKK